MSSSSLTAPGVVVDPRALWALRFLAGTPALVFLVPLTRQLWLGEEPGSPDWRFLAVITLPYLVTVLLLRPRTWKLGLRLAQQWGAFVAILLSFLFLFSFGGGIPTAPLLAAAAVWHAALSWFAWREYQAVAPKSPPPVPEPASTRPAVADQATAGKPVLVGLGTLWTLRVLAVGPILALTVFLAPVAGEHPKDTVLVVALWTGLVIPYLAIFLTLRPKTWKTGLTVARNLGATVFIVLTFFSVLSVADDNTLILWGVVVWHGVMYWIAKRAQTRTSA